MSKKSKDSLAESMKAGLAGRSGDLASVLGRDAPKPVAVPLRDDTYEIQLESIQPDPNQPRKVFDKQKLEELAASIRERGVRNPIDVYEAEPGSYTIITGERRWRAAKLADLTSVPCIVRGPDYDRSLIDVDQLIENVQRADLEPVEAAHALHELMQKHELSQSAAAKRIGKPRTWVVELASILKIDEQLLERGQHLGKQVLVEIARAPEPEHPELIKHALSGDGPLERVRQKRSNRQGSPRVVYYRESFPLENEPELEIRWKKPPDEVDPVKLAEHLGNVVRQLIGRAEG